MARRYATRMTNSTASAASRVIHRFSLVMTASSAAMAVCPVTATSTSRSPAPRASASRRVSSRCRFAIAGAASGSLSRITTNRAALPSLEKTMPYVVRQRVLRRSQDRGNTGLGLDGRLHPLQSRPLAGQPLSLDEHLGGGGRSP